MISLRARCSIDLTYWSISCEVADHHPIVKRPDEVTDLATLDLAPLISGSGPVGVWRRDAGLINQQGQHVIKQGLPKEDTKQTMCVLNGQAACQSTTFACVQGYAFNNLVCFYEQ